jgi:CRP-like cAMP-binding protein
MNTPDKKHEKIARLQQIDIFRPIHDNETALSTIADILHTVRYKAGDHVFREGDVGSALYIINRGTITVEKLTRQHEPYTVTELSAQEQVFVGEMALLDPDIRSATVVCKSACEFFTLERDALAALGEREPALVLPIVRELSRILCRRLRKANTDIITLFDALVEETAQSEGIRE